MLLKEVLLPILKHMLFFTTTIALKSKEKSQGRLCEAINHKKALELVFKNLKNNEGFDERY